MITALAALVETEAGSDEYNHFQIEAHERNGINLLVNYDEISPNDDKWTFHGICFIYLIVIGCMLTFLNFK